MVSCAGSAEQSIRLGAALRVLDAEKVATYLQDIPCTAHPCEMWHLHTGY